MQDIGQRLALCWLDNHMNVIGHNDEYVEHVPLKVEVPQRINHDLRNIWLLQKALAISLIKPALSLLLKTFLIFVFRSRIPRFWMEFPPRFQVFFPLP